MADTAAERLERILYLLPAASAEGGAEISDLSRTLGVSRETVLGDLTEVMERDYYHPAGGADDLQITVEGEKVKIWSKRKFTRPMRLTSREALALSLGLRVLALESDETRAAQLLCMADRLARWLSSTPPEDLWPRYEVEGAESGDSEIFALLREAAASGRRCRIRYTHPGASLSDRTLSPYALASASGRWYVIGSCDLTSEVRVFRLDRILEARATPEEFEVPAQFDVGEYLRGGRVYRADEEVEVRVRYSPRISAWVRERGPVEEREDGSVVVSYPVADPDWAVRHVLSQGAEAEILGPSELRDRVAGVLEGFFPDV